MPVQLQTIPSVLTPGVYMEIDNSQAVQGTPGQRHVALLIGLRLSAGTIAAEVVTPITSPVQGGEYFGRGSQLDQMIRGFKAANPNTELHAIALNEDVAGVKATCTLTVTGTATEDGTLAYVWGGRRRTVAVTTGDDHEDVAAAIKAADDADGDSATTSAVLAGVVTVSAKHKGLYGNDLSIFANYYAGEKTPAGIAIAITAFANGATDPDAGDAVAALGGDTQYHTIVTGFIAAANMLALEDEMVSRWSALRAIEGIVFAAFRGAYAASQSYGDARNSPYSSIMATGPSPTPPWVWASVYAAVCAASSSIDPAKPLQYLRLPGLLPPLTAAQFIRSERDLLLADGMATCLISGAGEVSIERARTTYQESPQAVEDPSYRDVETLRTLSYLRYSFGTRMRLKFGGAKIADDDTAFDPGQLVATPKVVRAETIALYEEWERAALVEGTATFKAQLIVERDPDDTGRMLVFHPPNLVNQLRVMGARMAFIL
jgi:phage tail sheath gpL-like